MDPLSLPPVARARASFDAAKRALEEAEKAYVSAVLDAFPGQRDDALEALGWGRRQGYRRLAALGLSSPRWGKGG